MQALKQEFEVLKRAYILEDEDEDDESDDDEDDGLPTEVQVSAQTMTCSTRP